MTQTSASRRLLAALVCTIALAAAGCARERAEPAPPAPRPPQAPAVTAPPAAADGPVSLGD
ncbi:MAG TPA: hypothetical protein VGC06_07145, partial [Actinomycetes bacterium]